MQERGEIAGAELGLRGLELGLHGLAVDGALDRAKHADRGGAGRALGEVGEREREARWLVMCIVHEQGVLSHVGYVDDLEGAVGALDDAALVLRPEADRLSVHEPDLVDGLRPACR